MEQIQSFIVSNYIWIIVGAVALLMVFIGFLAEKTDFGKKSGTTEPKAKKEKKEEPQPVVESFKPVEQPVDLTETPSVEVQPTEPVVEPVMEAPAAPVEEVPQTVDLTEAATVEVPPTEPVVEPVMEAPAAPVEEVPQTVDLTEAATVEVQPTEPVVEPVMEAPAAPVEEVPQTVDLTEVATVEVQPTEPVVEPVIETPVTEQPIETSENVNPVDLNEVNMNSNVSEILNPQVTTFNDTVSDLQVNIQDNAMNELIKEEPKSEDDETLRDDMWKL